MGLLDKIMGKDYEGKIEKEDSDFASVVVQSDNIIREIKHVAAAQNLSQSDLDFKILKTITSYLLIKEDGWIETDSKNIGQFKNVDFILNPDLKIKQQFKVEIFKIEDNEEKLIIPQITLGGNKALTKIVVTIKKDLEVKYFSKLEEQIIEKINKKKIEHNILVGLHDEYIHNEVKKVVSNIRVNGIIDKDYMFVACQGYDPVFPINDKFIYHYKQKHAIEDEQGRIDYSSRGYVLAVSENECIMEYIKPVSGTSGRSCQGKFLEIKEPTNDQDVNITYTENIIKKEDDEHIQYIANKSGYVIEDSSGKFDIQDQMEVESVDFKSTGSIVTDMSSNVKINIKENDIFKDAVGPGMSVETYELKVEGNIGSGAKIKVEILDIGGQTHKTSMIEAKNAKIAIHRGELTGEIIKIERLEGGKVIGDTVSIGQAIGGEINARTVIIETLSSNVRITASEKIEITKLIGMNNKLVIDPSSTKEFIESIEKTSKEIKDIFLKIQPIPKQLEQKKRTIGKTKQTIQEIKEKIIELKNSGKTPPTMLLVKIKEFQTMVNSYNDALKDYKNEKFKMKNLKDDLNQIQQKVFSAKIINHSPWKELNEITFKLMSPKIEKIYNTKEHEIIKEFSLQDLGEGEYNIKTSSEQSE